HLRASSGLLPATSSLMSCRRSQVASVLTDARSSDVESRPCAKSRFGDNRFLSSAGMRRRSMPLSLRAHVSHAHHTDAMDLNDCLIFGGDEMRCTCRDDHEGSGGKGLEA